jgi:general secretion pathway protein G
MKPAMTRHHDKALTLVEILAVIVILGLLATTLSVGISSKMSKAKKELARTQIVQIEGQVQMFQLDTRRIPPASGGLEALSADPAASWYVEPSRLRDPWGNPFKYLVPGADGHPYEIVSYGADGRPGGTGDDADITSIKLRD